jgi:hypothetical protein
MDSGNDVFCLCGRPNQQVHIPEPEIYDALMGRPKRLAFEPLTVPFQPYIPTQQNGRAT